MGFNWKHSKRELTVQIKKKKSTKQNKSGGADFRNQEFVVTGAFRLAIQILLAEGNNSKVKGARAHPYLI